ncbi:hypothetical protein ACX80J_13370 [Arthrobacter sp. MDB2-24]
MLPFHPEVVPAPLRHRKRGRKPTRARGRRQPPAWRAPLGGEDGNAVVEFVFLGVVLLVPVVYLVLTVGQLQGGSFAVVGAADQAAKVYVDAPTPQAADSRARQAVRIALADFGFGEDQAAVDIACSEECLAPGSTVTVVVRLEVPLPLVPGIAGSHASAATVDATSTQIVERFG